MTGEERRRGILVDIESAQLPISGSALAKKYKVSRQVIVQDIALLRAAKKEIIATTKGYMIKEQEIAVRIFEVEHSDEEIEEELNAIVDLGGVVKDVSVTHEVYGFLQADLHVSSRRDVKMFLLDIRNGKSSPLKNLTSGMHCHTVEAKSEEILDLIENELKEKGYLRGCRRI
ncbi:transcription repressor NadR [Lachnoclostridium sp. An181]|uniref:transcription repressor NadR n=1 Tax=Lachnoclostridium sp. An181 TaxID=1965575 RepID=UPI000B3774A2|nr:transcription repressor NadR [Lachnoclostridium sp. An181]OUP50705.1 DNA-binding transcriptional regulator [Lachnoclostridium sp. An181]